MYVLVQSCTFYIELKPGLRVYTVFRIWPCVTYPDFRYVTRFVQCTCLVKCLFSATALVDHAREARLDDLLAIMWRLIALRALDLSNLHAFSHQHTNCRGCFRICSDKASKNGGLTHMQTIFLPQVQHLWPLSHKTHCKCTRHNTFSKRVWSYVSRIWGIFRYVTRSSGRVSALVNTTSCQITRLFCIKTISINWCCFHRATHTTDALQRTASLDGL